MNVKELIAKGMCPNCHGRLKENRDDYIACASDGVTGCRLHGNPEFMKFCEHVPIFQIVTESTQVKGQLYKHSWGDKDSYYTLAGTVEGCGREIQGDYCISCREFLPHPVDHVETRSKVKPARAQFANTRHGDRE